VTISAHSSHPEATEIPTTPHPPITSASEHEHGTLDGASCATTADIDQSSTGEPRRSDSDHRDEGSALLWVLLFLPALLVAAGLVFDGGAAINGKQLGSNVAAQAARVGVDQMSPDAGRQQQVPSELDSARASEAACAYVAAAWPGATCSASLSTTEMDVEVTNQVPTQLLSIIGMNTFTVTARGTASTVIGIDQEVTP
jgi:hypothetical protein